MVQLAEPRGCRLNMLWCQRCRGAQLRAPRGQRALRQRSGERGRAAGGPSGGGSGLGRLAAQRTRAGGTRHRFGERRNPGVQGREQEDRSEALCVGGVAACREL